MPASVGLWPCRRGSDLRAAMKKLLALAAALFLSGLVCLAQVPLTGAGLNPSSFVATCSESTTYFGRVTLSNARKSQYNALICGLVTDGVWTILDVLYVYATLNSTTALINLPNNTYAGTNASSLAFTVDRGFTGSGIDGQNLGTGFNPVTALGNYVINSAHLSVWNLANVTGGTAVTTSTLNAQINLYPKYTDNNAYLRVNDASPSAGFAMADPRGFLLGNRDGSLSRQGYKNGVSVGTFGSVASATVPSLELVALGSALPTDNTTAQAAMMSAGGSLDATKSLALYNRLRTYMTAVGVP